MIKQTIKNCYRLTLIALTSMSTIALSACQHQATEKNMISKSSSSSEFSEFEQKIAERMSLDIRYFCADINGKASVPPSKQCRQALPELPQELAEMIAIAI